MSQSKKKNSISISRSKKKTEKVIENVEEDTEIDHEDDKDDKEDFGINYYLYESLKETFENEFRDALAKGQISQNDRHALNAEAERLHLTEQDVNRIMEKVRHELKFQVQGLTAHLNPEQLLEMYRQQVSQLRSLVQSDDFAQAHTLVLAQDNTTATERAIFETLRK